MIFVLIVTPVERNSTIFFIYLLIGNALMIGFHFLMTKFFTHCHSHVYEKSQIAEDIDDKIELLDIGKAQQQAAENDIRKNFDENTLSYPEILKRKSDVYLGMTLNFLTTLACFPVLTFRIDINVPEYFKFTIITLIFNIGDIASRYFYDYYPFSTIKQAHAWNIGKIMSIFIHFWCIDATSGFFSWLVVKVLVIFLFAFINGYLCMAYFAFASEGLPSAYDRNRSGNVLAMSLELGLMLGSCISLLW
jgi:hypothetical protein